MVNFKFIAVALLGLATAPFSSATPIPNGTQSQTQSTFDVSNRYIIILKSSLVARDVDDHLSWVDNVHNKRSLVKRANSTTTTTSTSTTSTTTTTFDGRTHSFNISDFQAYAGHFNSDTINEILASDAVEAVEEDQLFQISSIVTQNSVGWGLAGLSAHNNQSTAYKYDSTAGAGTYAYVVDSGIRISHTDFEGRASRGYNAAGGTFEDSLGHGTHVAGTIASKTYGVAKKANIIDVKVFSGSETSTSIILAGLNWAISDIKNQSRVGKAVINMSIGGPVSNALNTAVATGYSAGVLTVVPSGNDNVQASTKSPASAPNAMTVGAIDQTFSETWYSNYGSAVDILAPGSSIKSTWYSSDTATKIVTGTSMAAPHVAGLALYLTALEKITTPAALASRIKALATTGNVSGHKTDSPSVIAFNGAA